MVIDGNRIFGDTAGVLADHEQGRDQQLFGDPMLGPQVFLYGDARAITDFARGGDDILHGILVNENNLFGDADTMSAQAEGGDDILLVADNTTGAPVHNFLFGDAHNMDGQAEGGNDI
jgi:serralysin